MDITWKSASREDWQRLTAGASVQQTWAYGDAMARLGARVRRAVICRDGQVSAVAQVLKRQGLRLISRGPTVLVLPG